jgi:hypothetical protein
MSIIAYFILIVNIILLNFQAFSLMGVSLMPVWRGESAEIKPRLSNLLKALALVRAITSNSLDRLQSQLR